MGIRIGELLGRLVSLSAHDIEDVLEEQRYTGRRFGEIALAWGLCTPADVWHAWSDQLEHDVHYVELEAVGVDTQALTFLPGELAERYEVIPLRAVGNRLVLGASEASLPRARAELAVQIHRDVRFVIVEQEHLRRAIESHYDRPRRAAPRALVGAA